MTKQNRNTRLFFGFLLLAGLANMIGRRLPQEWNALMSCVHYVIYNGLLIFWLEAVRVRLLPSRSRTYMYAAGFFMLLNMFLRYFAYNIAVTADVRRYTIYAYWIPMELISALFLMICIRIRRGEKAPGRWNEALLLVPAVILALGALTNDLHTLVYVPAVPMEQFEVSTGTYGYDIVFFLLNAWMVLAFLAGVVLLVLESGRMHRNTLLFFAADGVLWLGIVLLNNLFLYRHSNLRMFNVPETNTFALLGIFEISIRGRLIPYNEDYSGFFRALKMPVLITDRQYRPAYVSVLMPDAGRDELRRAVDGSLALPGDRKLSGRRISAGYAFWTEDESSIHRAQERLLEANETIEQENDLLKAETEQKERDAYLQSRNHIYHEIAELLYPCQKQITGILEGAVPGTDDFRDRITMVSVLNAYVKRKTNLLLLAEEGQMISAGELFLALQESAVYLTLAGVHTTVGKTEEGTYPVDTAVALYDAFERIAEQLIGRAPSLMVTIQAKGLRLAAQPEGVPDTEGILLPVRIQKKDSVLYMDIPAERGDDPV